MEQYYEDKQEWDDELSAKDDDINTSKSNYISSINNMTAYLNTYKLCVASVCDQFSLTSTSISNLDVHSDLIDLTPLNTAIDSAMSHRFGGDAADGANIISRTNATVNMQNAELNSLVMNLNGFNASSVTAGGTALPGKTYTGTNTYYHNPITGYISSADCLAMEMMITTVQVQTEWDDVVTVLKSFVKVLVFLYGPAEADYRYNILLDETVGSVNGTSSIAKVAASVATIITEMVNVGDGLTGIFSVFTIARRVINVVKAIVVLLTNIRGAIGEFVALFSITLLDLRDSVYINTYATEMFPNRSTAEDKASLKLQDFSGIAKPVGHDITPILAIFGGTFLTRSDIAFSGAQTEYIFYGSRNEIENQVQVYNCIFVLRLLANILAVFTNTWIANLASAANVFAPLVYIFYLVAEASLDMKFLTMSGSKLTFIKASNQIFLQPDTLDNVASQAEEVLGDLDEDADPFDVFTSIVSPVDMTIPLLDGVFGLNYTDYLWVLLHLVPIDTRLARIGHLVEMEMRYYQEKKTVGYATFRLADTRTFIKVDAKADFEMVFPIPMLPGTQTLSLEKTVYRGY